MANYLFVYYGGNMAATPAEQQKSMDEWNKWFSSLGKAAVDIGAPTMPGKIVSSRQVTSRFGANPVTGYSIVKADSIDAAVDMAKSCPMVMDGSGRIAVYNVVAM